MFVTVEFPLRALARISAPASPNAFEFTLYEIWHQVTWVLYWHKLIPLHYIWSMYIRDFNDRDVSIDDFCQDLHTRWVRLQVQKVGHKTIHACRENTLWLLWGPASELGVLLVLMKTKYQVRQTYSRDLIFTGGLPLGGWSFARCHLRISIPSAPMLQPRRYNFHSPPACVMV